MHAFVAVVGGAISTSESTSPRSRLGGQGAIPACGVFAHGPWRQGNGEPPIARQLSASIGTTAPLGARHEVEAAGATGGGSVRADSGSETGFGERGGARESGAPGTWGAAGGAG